MRLDIDLSDRYSFLQPQNLLRIQKANKELEHFRPHNIGDIHHQLSYLIDMIGAKIIFNHINKFLQIVFCLNLFADFSNMNL